MAREDFAGIWQPPKFASGIGSRLCFLLEDAKRRRATLPTDRWLAVRLHCSVRSVTRERKKLIDGGFLVVEEESGQVKRWSLQWRLPVEGGVS